MARSSGAAGSKRRRHRAPHRQSAGVVAEAGVLVAEPEGATARISYRYDVVVRPLTVAMVV
jgi:hypothetical protein